ncbi:hypothetical protein [Pinisolibacter sp.]|mgnify:CR=1 FL=1|uniref:hypothetical protein n=1 Tax=Pinisolibacter sp. TaxID=2172024 RepID=UPI002FDCCA22
MPDARSENGFRSLVQQIQENDAGPDERQRPQRRRPTMPAGGRETAKDAVATAAAPPPSKAPVRLLQRRWL